MHPISNSDTGNDPLPLTPPPGEGRLRVVPLGGLGEFGKNCMVFEYGKDMILVDCGMKFPEDEMFGVDMVIPDFSYIMRAPERLRAVILTHGHEDHIGAIPYFVRQLGRRIEIYGTRLTLALVLSKLEELGLEDQADLIEAPPGGRLFLDSMEIEFIPVTHSMPDAIALAIHLPIGIVLHTGDFKFDPVAPDEAGTLRRFAERIDPGNVLLLLSDSTNIDREGISPTEESVRDGLRDAIAVAPRTIIMATFSSSLNRIQTALELAGDLGRKVAICGYSLERNFDIAVELGLIRHHESLILPLNELIHLPPERRMILTTGTQGEPLSALSRLSLNSFKGYTVQPGDVVILSSRIIPGNERCIYKMINHFYRHGARVITERDAQIHASGHAHRGEMRALLEKTRPRHFIPIHGEHRQLIGHRDLAIEVGIPDCSVTVLENGMSFEIDGDGAVTVVDGDHAGQVLVDGKRMDGVDEVVLRDRKHLSCDGMLTVILVIDQHSHKIIAGPDIVSRGFILMDENEPLIEACKQVVIKAFEDSGKESQEEWEVVKAAVRKALRKFLAMETDRYPVILPVVVEI